MLLRIPQARISHSRHDEKRTGRNRKARPAKLRPHQAVAFFDNTSEAGMICETAENRAEGMEVKGGGLPKWWEKVGFGRMCSTSWRFPA
jgi:hypothetical protein